MWRGIRDCSNEYELLRTGAANWATGGCIVCREVLRDEGMIDSGDIDAFCLQDVEYLRELAGTGIGAGDDGVPGV